MGTSERIDHGGPAVPETPAERMGLYLATLRRRWKVAVSIVAVAFVAGLTVGELSPKSYDATARVLVDQQKQVDALLGASDTSPDPERDVNTGLQLVTLEPIAESVRRKLRLDQSSAELISKVGTEVDSNSSVISITVRDGSAARAARIANAFAAGYRDFRARSARASVEAAVTSATDRLRQLSPTSAEYDALRVALARLQSAAAVQTGGVQVVRRATASTATPSRRPLLGGLLAGLLGLILAAVTIIVLARTDKRLHEEADLEALVGRPVLATVPDGGGQRARERAREALVTLALSLTLPSRQPVPSALLVTSPGPEDGTAHVALGLAGALAAIGRRAIVVEADFREPTFANQLELGTPAGLVAILGGARTLDDELVELERSADRREGRAWALPACLASGRPAAGSSPPLPQSLLAGDAMKALVVEARRRADVVLIAGPPAGLVGDPLALVPLVDAVLLVARLDVTRSDDVLRAIRALETVEAPLVGAVATSGPPQPQTGLGRAAAGVREGRRSRSARGRTSPRAGSPTGRPEHAGGTPSEVTLQ